ncbi:MAG: SpaA isopeptide-forming pilin-related protein [Chloroflexota bacterium]
MTPSVAGEPRRKSATVLFTVVAAFALVLSLLVSIPAVSAAAPNVATGAGIIVDGDAGDWDSTDFFADMHRAGTPDKPVESKLSLRYDCDAGILYVLVRTVAGVDLIDSDGDNFVKFGTSDKQVDGSDAPADGTQPDFEYLANDAGWEASFAVAPGTYANLNVHAQVDDGGEQTSAVEDRAISMTIVCIAPTGTPTPTPVPTGTPAPTPTPVPTGTPGATGTPNATPTPTPEGDEDASLKIRKISTERTATNRVIRLEGAVFTVEGQPGTFTTDEHGEFCITGLPEDVVLRVTEIVPPAGYELANPAWQDVEVDNDGDCDSAEAVFENPPEVVATPTPTPEGSEAGSTGTPAPTATPKVTSTPEGSVAAATGTPTSGNLPNTAAGSPLTTPLVVFGFGMLLLGSIGTLAYANVIAARRRR